MKVRNELEQAKLQDQITRVMTCYVQVHTVAKQDEFR